MQQITSVDDGSPAGKPTADTFDGEHDELEHASDNELENPRVIGFSHGGLIKHAMCHGDRGSTLEKPASRGQSRSVRPTATRTFAQFLEGW